MTNYKTRSQIDIGKVIRDGVAFNPKNWNGDSLNSDSLLQAVNQLFDLLTERKIDYLLVGGIALLQYVEGRNTEDIDLIMALDSLKQLPEIQLISQDDNFARGKFGELQIDFLLTSNPLFEIVRRQHATDQSFGERKIHCATVDGLLLLKLYALPSLYRLGNFARVGLYENDIATLIHEYKPPIHELMKELSKYLHKDDMKSVHDILAEIQARLDRFEKKS
jgi:hypothetical protein